MALSVSGLPVSGTIAPGARAQIHPVAVDFGHI
jgi:hypothetical protein